MPTSTPKDAGKPARLSKQKSPDVDSCATCRFWREDMTEGTEGRPGECRRFPPVCVSDGEGVYSVLPNTDSGDWCGEHGQRLQ